MDIPLTDELRQALRAAPGGPVRLVDEQTNEAFVVLRAEAYERLKSLVDGDALTSEQVGALVEQTMREYDEGDPLLESYQKYRNPT